MRQTIGFLLVTLIILTPLASEAHAMGMAQTSSVSQEPSLTKEGTSVLTLDQALKEAMERNPEISAAKKKWEEEKTKIVAAGSLPDPQAGVEQWGKHETWYDVSQTVPFPGKLILKGQSQAHEANRELGYYEAKQKEILQKVKVAYYGYFLAERQIEIFEENTSILKNFSKVTENKYSVSKASQSDLLRAEVEYSKALNELVVLKQEKEVAMSDLNSLLDRDPNFEIGKPQEPALGTFNLTYEELVKIALENRPEVHAARHHVNHMDSELLSAKSDFIPDPMFQYSRRTFDNDTKDDNILMVKFNVPFIWFWRQGSLVGAAQKAKEGAQEELRSMEAMTRSDIKSIFVKAKTARQMVELYRTSIIPQSHNALKITQAGYESGSEGFSDFLDTQRSSLTLQMEYYQYLARYWSYLASLERIAGKDLVPFEAETKEGTKI